jgi:nicotinate-nucleotide pyrophosphorylase (carboxylating)
MFVFHPLSESTRRELIAGGLDPDAVAGIVRNAITEDLMGGVDVTSVATIDADQRSTATFGAREAGVIAGLPIVAAVIETVCGDEASDFTRMVSDGASVQRGTKVAEVTAPTRLLLTAERTALNLLCHLSGVASATRRWADALEGTSAVVREASHSSM